MSSVAGGRREHDNNFNLIRLVAASQVMLVHALNHFEVKGVAVDVLKAVPGVPTFFFISGFLICTSYKRMRGRGNGAFFANRALRIYPALVTCVLLAVVSVWSTGYFDGRDLKPMSLVAWLVGQITFFQFYNPDFMRMFGTGVLNGALWTITVELQFYVLVPLLWFLIERRPLSLAAVFIASLATNLYLHGWADGRSLPIKLLYVSFLPWLYIFVFGFVVAYRDDAAEAIRRLRLPWLLLGYIAAMNFIGKYSDNAQNAINPIAVFFLGCLIIKVSTARLPVSRRLASFISRQDFSYGLYLYHMPVINILLFLGLFSAGVNIALVAAVSAAAAALSWYLVERPALGFKR